MEQGQDLGCAAADVFVRVLGRVFARLPRHTGMRHGLERPGLVLAPDRQPKLGAERVGLLDQLFFAVASGSLTRTTPCLRWPQQRGDAAAERDPVLAPRRIF